MADITKHDLFLNDLLAEYQSPQDILGKKFDAAAVTGLASHNYPAARIQMI